jgi:hypothetical protein
MRFSTIVYAADEAAASRSGAYAPRFLFSDSIASYVVVSKLRNGSRCANRRYEHESGGSMRHRLTMSCYLVGVATSRMILLDASARSGVLAGEPVRDSRGGATVHCERYMG